MEPRGFPCNRVVPKYKLRKLSENAWEGEGDCGKSLSLSLFLFFNARNSNLSGECWRKVNWRGLSEWKGPFLVLTFLEDALGEVHKSEDVWVLFGKSFLCWRLCYAIFKQPLRSITSCTKAYPHQNGKRVVPDIFKLKKEKKSQITSEEHTALLCEQKSKRTLLFNSIATNIPCSPCYHAKENKWWSWLRAGLHTSSLLCWEQ